MTLESVLSMLPGPARRGVETLGFTKLEEFTGVSRKQLQDIHGVGPKAISILEAALAEQGLTLQSWTEGKSVLTDPEIFPDDSVLEHHLAGVKPLFDRMLQRFQDCDPPLVLEWRYYADGGSWLGKVTARKKTIIWVAVHHHMVRASFYFKKDAVPIIERSGLDERYRPQLEEILRTGRTKAVTIDIDRPEHLEQMQLLIDIKLSLI